MANAHRSPVVIVGGGIAGLVSALELAIAGVEVTLLEKQATVGGKLYSVHVNGADVDSGPTVFTMRWVFDALFEKAGTRLQEELTIHRAEILARHAWSKHERLDLFASHDQSAQAIRDFAGPAEADRFIRFCRQAQTTYRTLEAAYIRSERPTIASMHQDIGFSGLKVLWDLGMFQSLSRSLRRYFQDPRLHQLFSRYATYCGSSPLSAPATLMLIAEVEMQGVWVIEGGMSALAQAIATLAKQHGAVIRTESECQSILMNQGKVSGVELTSGERIMTEHVIFNGDVSALRQGDVQLRDEGGTTSSFGSPRDDLKQRSLSALTLSIHAKTHGFPLVHHNLFFNADYDTEFHDIFQRHRLPAKPTVYVCAQDRLHSPAAVATDFLSGQTPERLLLLINAPATGDRQSFQPSEIEACTQASFSLMERCGFSIDHQPHNTVTTTPASFHRRFPATGGALYGHATHGWMSAFARQSSASRIPGLYLAGGSVHPGPGVPMAAMSGRLAAATLMAHLGLTKQSGRVVISGGMSTP